MNFIGRARLVDPDSFSILILRHYSDWMCLRRLLPESTANGNLSIDISRHPMTHSTFAMCVLLGEAAIHLSKKMLGPSYLGECKHAASQDWPIDGHVLVTWPPTLCSMLNPSIRCLVWPKMSSFCILPRNSSPLYSSSSAASLTLWHSLLDPAFVITGIESITIRCFQHENPDY